MSSGAVLYIFYLYLLRWLTHCDELKPMCQKQNETATEAVLISQLSQVERKCKERAIRMGCCMSGVSSIQWYQQSKDDPTQWVEFLKVPGSERRYEENHQTAYIHQVWKDPDEGFYRCIGQDESGHRISSNISLTLFDCTVGSRPEALLPYRLSDKKPKKVYYRLPGQALEWSCLGNFGDVTKCNYECTVTWIKKSPGGVPVMFNTHKEKDLNGTQPERVYVKERELTEKGLMENILVLNDIKESDYGKYTCMIANPTDQVHINVTLEKGEENPQKNTFLVPLIIILSIVLLIMVVLPILYVKKRHEIRLRWKDQFGNRIDGEKKYDLFILYDDLSEDDSTLVEDHLLPILRSQLHYAVCVLPENPDILNHPIQSLYDQASASSRSLVAVISDDLVRSNLLKTCLLDASTAQYRNLIYVTRKGCEDCVDQLDDGIQVTYRIAHKVKWPGSDSCSEKELAKFWVRFRLYLPPKPKGNDVSPEAPDGIQVGCDRIDSTASHQPLIPNTNEETSAGMFCNSSDGKSPAQDTKATSSTVPVVLESGQVTVSNEGPQIPRQTSLEDDVFNESDQLKPYIKNTSKLVTVASDDSGHGMSLSLSPT